MELPQYTLYLSKPRILIPKTILMIFLGMFLYFGAWLNLKLLNIIIPVEYHFFIILGIITLVIMQFILNYIKYSNYKYLFFKDKIVFEGKTNVTISYLEVQNIEVVQNNIDKLFHTGTININPIHKMQYISNTNQIYCYLQKLIEFSRKTSVNNPNYNNQY